MLNFTVKLNHTQPEHLIVKKIGDIRREEKKRSPTDSLLNFCNFNKLFLLICLVVITNIIKYNLITVTK
jgi:hypothetical protein